MLFFGEAYKIILQYGHTDTLNSKIYSLGIILSRNGDDQKYVAPHLHLHT